MQNRRIRRLTRMSRVNDMRNGSRTILLAAVILLVGIMFATPFLHQHSPVVEPANCPGNIIQISLVASFLFLGGVSFSVPRNPLFFLSLPQIPLFSRFFGFIHINKAPPVW
ncbi:MAG: hypothetical protein L6Q94_20550 [Calditrichia bacterium]|nr:hypothetical protein [Calditrichia bacterium]